MESMVNFSFRSKPVFHSLPAVDLEMLLICNMELFMTIANNFQPLTIVVKISAEFLNPHMTTKDDYYYYYYNFIYYQIIKIIKKYIYNSLITKKKKKNGNRFQLKTGQIQGRIDNIKLPFLHLRQKRT